MYNGIYTSRLGFNSYSWTKYLHVNNAKITTTRGYNNEFKGVFKISQLIGGKTVQNYLESAFDYTKNDWYKLIKKCNDRNDLLTLLTCFQLYLRKLKCKELLYILKLCNRLDVSENNNGIDVYKVLLCEMLYKLMYENINGLSILEICEMCKLLMKLKYIPNVSTDDEVIPICEFNNYSNNIKTCENCKLRYNNLLIQRGNDIIMLLMLSLGKSLYIQSYNKLKLHVKDIIPYLSLVCNNSCTLCSHVIRSLIIRYYHVFIDSNSIYSISILLYTISKCKVRLHNMTESIVRRLIKQDNLQLLLDRESFVACKMIAISQIILFCISSPYKFTKYQNELDFLLYKLLVYTCNNYKSWIDDNQWSKFATHLNLLHKSCKVERFKLYNHILNDELLIDLFKLADGHVPKFDDENKSSTSNTHIQVSKMVSELNFDHQNEVYINPYIIDIYIPSREIIIEIDGPYHYTQNLNERVNKILNRGVDYYTHRYTLNSQLKHRLLSKSNYKIVNIPFYSWPCNKHEQMEHLLSVL